MLHLVPAVCKSCNLYQLSVQVATYVQILVQVATCTKSQLAHNIYTSRTISTIYNVLRNDRMISFISVSFGFATIKLCHFIS